MQHFYSVAGPGSWQEVVAGTGHVSFCDAGELQEGLELLCPGEIIPIQARPTAGWNIAAPCLQVGSPKKAQQGLELASHASWLG